ncbi:MAG TPA: hypothetical protein DEE98_06050 [Elusimicrobia bacterium]|nr:hypothetical protein [Elusimicrobiota bacterium]
MKVKIKIIAFLLVLSLGFNLAVIITLGHHRIFKPDFKNGQRQFNKMSRELKLSAEQREAMKKSRDEMMSQAEPLKTQLRQKRNELFLLIDAENIEQKKIDALVGEISDLQLRLEKKVVEHSLSMRKNLSPEQKKKFSEMIRRPFEKMGRGSRMMRGDGMMGQ